MTSPPPLALCNARIYTPLAVIERGTILIEGGRIVEVRAGDGAPAAFRALDLAGLSLAPGFVDVHVHGGGGHSLITEDAEEVRAYARWVVRHGVTGFLVTTLGETPQQLERLIAGALPALGEIEGGARALGLHLEGPFISLKRLGAFRREWALAPDRDVMRGLLAAGRGGVRLVTLAPELEGGESLVREVTAAGAVASLGPSDATYEEALRAFEWGVRHVTHCFNAARPFHHRDPGWLAAALTAEGVSIELIADGVHVHPAALLMAERAKGSEGVVLVTDAIAPAGLGDGNAAIHGASIRVEGGAARLSDGTIAGSVATMDACVRNAAAWLNLP